MALDLSQAQNRRFAQHFMVSGARLGLTNTAILGEIRSVGLTYGNDLFSADMARIRSTNPRLPRMTSDELSSLIPQDRVLTMLGAGRTKYQYVFSGMTRDPETGQFTGRVTWSFTSFTRHTGDFAALMGASLAPSTNSVNGYVSPESISDPTEVVWQQS